MIDINGKRVIVSGLISGKLDLDSHLQPIRKKIINQGGQIVGELIQRRGVSRSKRPGGSKDLDKPLSSSTYISSGKVEELKSLAEKEKCDVIIFINELSTKQKENLNNLTSILVDDLSNM